MFDMRAELVTSIEKMEKNLKALSREDLEGRYKTAWEKLKEATKTLMVEEIFLWVSYPCLMDTKEEESFSRFYQKEAKDLIEKTLEKPDVQAFYGKLYLLQNEALRRATLSEHSLIATGLFDEDINARDCLWQDIEKNRTTIQKIS